MRAKRPADSSRRMRLHPDTFKDLQKRYREARLHHRSTAEIERQLKIITTNRIHKANREDDKARRQASCT